MGGGTNLSKDIGIAWRRLNAPRTIQGITVNWEGEVPIYRVPPAISGFELDPDSRLKRAKWHGNRKGSYE